MNKRKKKQTISYKPILLVVGAILLLFFLFPKTDVSAGYKYIVKEENKSLDSLSKKLSKIRKKEINAAQKEGTLNPFSLYNDYVFFGDSRVQGFSDYGFLEKSRVFAEKGHTIRNITDWEKQIKTIRPSNVYFSYGMNDLGLDIDGQEGGYDVYYEKQIKKMLEYCPKDAKVYVNSIVQVTPSALAKNPAWESIDTYNKKIKSMCKKNGWTYVDNTEICDEGHADIYESDGIHFKAAFYTIWALNMNEDAL